MSSSVRRRKKRAVAVVTGTRAEYGLLRSTMEAISSHRDLKLQLVVTGMHLLPKFGRTIDQILSDGWKVDGRIPMQKGHDDALDQAIGLSRGVAGIARFLEEAKSDVVLLLGDRIEAMAGALAGVTTGKTVAHIHGGDLAAGDFDDSLRHAITKLADVHLPATRRARQRIIRMGENPDRVHWVGAPGLDRLNHWISRTPGDRSRSGKALIVQHACGRSPAYEKRVTTALLRAVKEAGLIRTVIFPNSDRGHTGVIEAIEACQKRDGDQATRVIRSVDYDTYLGMLIEADLLVGNSSSGIIEAATAGTPVVNIGPRQDGRERSGTSVVDAQESLPSIRDAIRKALVKRPIIGTKTVYGDGRTGRRIAEILAQLP